MEEIINAVIRWGVTFLLGGIVSIAGYAIGRKKKENTEQEDIKKGVQCLLRAEIIRSYEKYLDKGFCPIYAKEALRREYEAYHNLGGNDVATELYHKVMKMPEDKEHHNETEGI